MSKINSELGIDQVKGVVFYESKQMIWYIYWFLAKHLLGEVSHCVHFSSLSPWTLICEGYWVDNYDLWLWFMTVERASTI